MLSEVARLCPNILSWVLVLCEKPSYLLWEGKIIMSESGQQQGDPLGCLLFALVFHLLIQRINDELDTELSVAYIDDYTVSLPLDQRTVPFRS